MKYVVLTGPRACGAVPLKSNVASSPRISTRTRIGSGAASTPSSSSQSSPVHTPSGSARRASRIARSDAACSASKHALSVSAPYRSTSSPMRRAATSSAANCAKMSPRRSSGLRRFDRMISIFSSSGPAAENRRTGEMRTPSWYDSVAHGTYEPGTAPPISAQCARLIANATSRVPANTGRIAFTSGR